MSNSNSPIGIFDSGVGGLTVVSEVIKTLPLENLIYFGDTARVPYGSKSKQTITKYSKQIVNFLLEKQVKAIIIACNSASTSAFEELNDFYNIPILEVVNPGVSLCTNDPTIKKVAVIGTQRTIESNVYENLIKKQRPDLSVLSIACPLFVPLAEEGLSDSEITDLTVKHYLSELLNQNVDALILGCTHYPLLKSAIQKFAPNIKILNPATATAIEMKNFLSQNNLLNTSPKNTKLDFFVSDEAKNFSTICNLLIENGKDYTPKVINIENY